MRLIATSTARAEAAEQRAWEEQAKRHRPVNIVAAIVIAVAAALLTLALLILEPGRGQNTCWTILTIVWPPAGLSAAAIWGSGRHRFIDLVPILLGLPALLLALILVAITGEPIVEYLNRYLGAARQDSE